MEIIGIIFGGLGLFFIGFRMISRNLRNLTGSRFRQLVQLATGTRLFAAVTGFISGLISQSAFASVFITTGFHTAGLLIYHNRHIVHSGNHNSVEGAGSGNMRRLMARKICRVSSGKNLN